MISSHIQAYFFIFEESANKDILKHNAKNEDRHNAVITKPLILKIHPNTKNKIEMISIHYSLFSTFIFFKICKRHPKGWDENCRKSFLI